jgi:hypothetical protein
MGAARAKRWNPIRFRAERLPRVVDVFRAESRWNQEGVASRLRLSISIARALFLDDFCAGLACKKACTVPRKSSGSFKRAVLRLVTLRIPSSGII